jgi:hypothetical protein
MYYRDGITHGDGLTPIAPIFLLIFFSFFACFLFFETLVL